MQSVSSSIWTHIAVSISYDDNHYTTGTLFLTGTINREQWKWWGTPHYSKHQNWSLIIRCFNVISRTLIGREGHTPLQKCSQCILLPKPTELYHISRYFHVILSNISDRMRCQGYFHFGVIQTQVYPSHTHTYTSKHTHTHTQKYIYIYIFTNLLSTSIHGY